MRWIILLLALAFTGLIGWAFTTGDFFAEGAQLTELAWGVVTLADLYLGFFLFAVFIFWAERSLLTSSILTVLLMTLGNGVAAIWLVVRFKTIKDRLRQETGA